MKTILIGIDDTDNLTSRGTGYLARLLSQECFRRGLRPLGVTRHQFLQDPRIAYTSHNSGACVAVEGDIPEQAAFAFDFVADRAADGSDPGVCIASRAAVTDNIIEYAKKATTEVVEQDEAMDLARRVGLDLRGLGGTHLGVIGALCSVGLRTEGNDGRFIDLPGLRELPDRIDAETLVRLGIRVEHRHNNGHAARRADVYETLGWVRPRLIGGQAVLIVEWSDGYDAWIPVDRKKNSDKPPTQIAQQ